MPTSFRHLVIAVALAAIALPASAQLPDNIPVDPEKSPADRQRERFEERHHATFSRMFASSHLALSPVIQREGAMVDVVVQGVVDLPGGDALHLTVGSRSYALAEATDQPFHVSSRESAYLFAMGYDVSLSRFFPASALARRAAIGISAGGIFADVGVVSVDLEPKYILPINQYWSLPVGLKLGTAILGVLEASNAATFIGASVGIKRHFGQRRQLE